ncbi:MAG: hypothetical protein R3C16_10115 [Hyphomonadaceae bacterium]
MTVHQALLNNLVINYCRPFVSNRTKDGATRTYPLRLVAGADGFDRDVHAQLLGLRHKMVAHSDDEYLDARFTGEAVVISKSDDPSSARKVPVRVGAITVALWGLLTRQWPNAIVRMLPPQLGGGATHTCANEGFL